MIRLLAAVSTVLFLAGCSSSPQPPNNAHTPAPANAKPLNGEQIQQMLVGQKFESLTEKGERFWQILNGGGTATIKIADYPEYEGIWMVKGDVICVTYKEYGKECNTVRSDGVSIWLIDENKRTTNNKFTLRQ